MISDEELYADRDRAVFTASPSLIAYLDGHLIDTGENLVPFELSSYRRVKSILTAIYEEYTFEVKPGKATKDNGILASLILYLKEHMVEDITLDTVSKPQQHLALPDQIRREFPHASQLGAHRVCQGAPAHYRQTHCGHRAGVRLFKRSVLPPCLSADDGRHPRQIPQTPHPLSDAQLPCR